MIENTTDVLGEKRIGAKLKCRLIPLFIMLFLPAKNECNFGANQSKYVIFM